MKSLKLMGALALLSILVASVAIAWQYPIPQTGPGVALTKGNVITSFDINTLTGSIGASAALDFASAAATVCSTDLTITATGAALNDVVLLGVPNGSVNAGSQFTAWVSVANTVTVRHCNVSAGANDPASGTFFVQVVKQS